MDFVCRKVLRLALANSGGERTVSRGNRLAVGTASASRSWPSGLAAPGSGPADDA